MVLLYFNKNHLQAFQNGDELWLFRGYPSAGSETSRGGVARSEPRPAHIPISETEVEVFKPKFGYRKLTRINSRH